MADNKTIMFLGAGEEQCEAIDIALDLGFKVVAVDGNPKAVGLKKAHIGINVDIKDVDKMVNLGNKYKIDGVMAHAVEIPVVIAKVANELRLPGIDPEIAEVATNKVKRLQRFKKHDIPCAEFEVAKNEEEAVERSNKLGFPCVFKPIDRSGARGVIKVGSEREVKDAFNHSINNTELGMILIEKYLTGRELSTESVIYNNHVYTVAFADRNYDKKRFLPFFIEDGGEMPTSLSDDQLNEVIKVVNNAIDALGINWGVAKGDVIINNGEVKIIEMAARTSGGRFCSQKVPLSTGIHILRPLIQMAVGLKPDLNDLKPKFSKGIAERFIFPKPGKIVKVEGVNEARNLKGIYQVSLDEDIKIGNVIGEVQDHTMRKGFVVAVGEDRQQAVKRAENAVKLINIATEDD